MGPITVRALGERAEVLLALKESLLSIGAIQVLKLMVMAAVSALIIMMIGALLLMMMVTTPALQEAVRHLEIWLLEDVSSVSAYTWASIRTNTCLYSCAFCHFNLT